MDLLVPFRDPAPHSLLPNRALVSSWSHPSPVKAFGLGVSEVGAVETRPATESHSSLPLVGSGVTSLGSPVWGVPLATMCCPGVGT